jgi:outer membrane biosynthesis protein TonB
MLTGDKMLKILSAKNVASLESEANKLDIEQVGSLSISNGHYFLVLTIKEAPKKPRKAPSKPKETEVKPKETEVKPKETEVKPKETEVKPKETEVKSKAPKKPKSSATKK